MSRAMPVSPKYLSLVNSTEKKKSSQSILYDKTVRKQ